jgi:hypothetical protein
MARVPLLVAVVLCALAVPAGAQEPRVAEFSLAVEHRVVAVSLEVEDAFAPEVMDRVRSGFPVTFTYDFALKSSRKLRDRTWAKARLTVTCKYDPVRVEYRLNFRKDGQLIETRYFHHWPEASQAMVRLDRLAVFDIPEEARGSQVFVTARAHFLDRSKWLVLPDDLEAPEVFSTIFTAHE